MRPMIYSGDLETGSGVEPGGSLKGQEEPADESCRAVCVYNSAETTKSMPDQGIQVTKDFKVSSVHRNSGAS